MTRWTRTATSDPCEIDHRDMASQPHQMDAATHGTHDGAAMAARSRPHTAQVTAGGVRPGRRVTTGVCYCCKTAGRGARPPASLRGALIRQHPRHRVRARDRRPDVCRAGPRQRGPVAARWLPGRRTGDRGGRRGRHAHRVADAGEAGDAVRRAAAGALLRNLARRSVVLAAHGAAHRGRRASSPDRGRARRLAGAGVGRGRGRRATRRGRTRHDGRRTDSDSRDRIAGGGRTPTGLAAAGDVVVLAWSSGMGEGSASGSAVAYVRPRQRVPDLVGSPMRPVVCPLLARCSWPPPAGEKNPRVRADHWKQARAAGTREGQSRRCRSRRRAVVAGVRRHRQRAQLAETAVS